MKSVSFSITRVNRLRRAAVRARTHLAERPDPWPVRSPSNGCFTYAYDANDLIRVFDTLRPPRQTDDPDVSDDERKPTGDAPVANWTWRRTAPRTWEPTYAERGTTKKVVLHIRDPVGGDRIYQATDTYQAGSYDCKTRTTVLCTGEGGIDY